MRKKKLYSYLFRGYCFKKPSPAGKVARRVWDSEPIADVVLLFSLIPFSVRYSKSPICGVLHHFLYIKNTDTRLRVCVFYGRSGIRTHVGVIPNGFQDRLVMTASISLRIQFGAELSSSQRYYNTTPNALCQESRDIFCYFFIFNRYFR